MADERINTTAVDQYGVKYTRVLQRQLQDDISRIEPFVTVMQGCTGKDVNIPFIGKAKMARITSPYQDIGEMNEAHFGNVVMRPVPFYDVHKFSTDNRLYNNNIDFSMQNIVTEVRSAANRQRDEVMLGVRFDEDDGCFRKLTVGTAPVGPYDEVQSSGILGTAYLGLQGNKLDDLGDKDTGDDMTTSVVPVDFSYDGLNETDSIALDKIIRGIELLKKRRAFVKGVTTCVVALTARQIAQIQRWESAMNRDYGFGSLSDGFKNKILGVNILETEMLPMIDVDGRKVRCCPMWVKEHMIYGVWQDIEMQVTPRVERGVNYGQVVTTMSMGATRKYRESVVQLLCAEDFKQD